MVIWPWALVILAALATSRHSALASRSSLLAAQFADVQIFWLNFLRGNFLCTNVPALTVTAMWQLLCSVCVWGSCRFSVAVEPTHISCFCTKHVFNSRNIIIIINISSFTLMHVCAQLRWPLLTRRIIQNQSQHCFQFKHFSFIRRINLGFSIELEYFWFFLRFV